MDGLLDILGEALGGVVGHPLVGVLGGVALVGALVLWLASAWWAWGDLGARTRDPISPYLAAAAMLLATPLLFPLALVVYRVVRPPQLAAEQAASELWARALGAPEGAERCPACGRRSEPDWRRCPACGAEVTLPCEGCHRPLGIGWTICPWCATETPGTHAEG